MPMCLCVHLILRFLHDWFHSWLLWDKPHWDEKSDETKSRWICRNTSLILWKASTLCISSKSSASHSSTSDSTVSAWLPFLEQKHTFFLFSPALWCDNCDYELLNSDVTWMAVASSTTYRGALCCSSSVGKNPTLNARRYAAATSISRHSKQGPNLLSKPFTSTSTSVWHFCALPLSSARYSLMRTTVDSR